MLSSFMGKRQRWFGFAVAGLSSCSSGTKCPGKAGLCLEPAASANDGGAAGESAGGMTGTEVPSGVGGAGGEPREVPSASGEGGAGDWRSLVTGPELSLGGDSGFDGLGFDPYCDQPTTVLEPLDLVVMHHFVTSGFYDDSGSELEVKISPERSPQHSGYALELHWKPTARSWAGLALQNDYDNWTGPGLCIEPGAARVQFQARGARGGELVDFGAVEPGREGVLLENQVLSVEWQTYAIDLTGVDYNHYSRPGGVRVGLSIVLANAGLGEQWVYVDDIRWLAAKAQP